MTERNKEIQGLMMKIKDGDTVALQRLMNIVTPGLMMLGLSYLKNKQDSEDCVQETFITIAIKHKTYSYNKNASGWIYQIMRRKCLDKLRETKHMRQTSLNESSGIDLDQYVFTKTEDRIFIETILNPLEITEKEVVLLHIWADMTFREISKTIHKPLVTTERIYKKSLEKIKNMVQNEPI